MVSEQPREERDLVALYAGRLRERPTPVAVSSRASRSAPPVRQFGRHRPISRRPITSQRTVAMSALVATAFVVSTQAASAASTHQVKPGETLSGIAAHYQLSVDQLAGLNAIENPDMIISGSTLTIAPPDATGGNSPIDPGRQHQVLAGETLFEIAQQYGMTVEAIASVNHLLSPDFIAAGSVLAIPTVSPNSTLPAGITPESSNLALHMVVAGETLGQIAAKYGVSVGSLQNANSLVDPNRIEVGQLLRIPGAGAAEQDGAVKLRGMPIQLQSLPLSCESAAASMATAYWGNQISEWVFIENMPYDANPHYGFRGEMTGPFGGTEDYGVYAEPLVPMLNNYGFVGEVFYAAGDSSMLTSHIDQGHPVIVWMTNNASVQERFYETSNGEQYALVPQQHAVVVYGYDDNQVFIADPGDASYRAVSWADFMRAWGYFDGMSLAVYPQ